MTRSRLVVALLLVAVVAAVWAATPRADAQGPTIKIGTIFDHSGPFSAAGAVMNYRGVKTAIDWANDHGGAAGKYKIVRVDADSQSKADAAINEAERLINVEKVDILTGIFSSAHAVPIAEILDGKLVVVFPKTFANAAPILPLPASSPFAAR